MYMGVVISLDLLGKKSRKKDSAEEYNTTDLGDDGEESSTVIDETEDGFMIHQDNMDDEEVEHPYERPVDAELEATAEPQTNDSPDVEVEQQEQPVEDDTDDEELLAQESQQLSPDVYKRVKDEQEEKMGGFSPVYQAQYGSDAFAVILSQPIDQENRIMHNLMEV